MYRAELDEFVARFLDAWNSGNVERVAACYTEDLVYSDPNTKGPITDKDAFLKYLTRLLSTWSMTWSTRESFALKTAGGYAFLWHARIRKSGQAHEVRLDGMDLVILDGEKILRNEVYFDRSVLLPLMEGN